MKYIKGTAFYSLYLIDKHFGAMTLLAFLLAGAYGYHYGI